jgi:hypothetical protein
MTMGWRSISSHRTNASITGALTEINFNQVGSDGTRTAMRIDADGNVDVGDKIRLLANGRLYFNSTDGFSPFLKEDSNGVAVWAGTKEVLRVGDDGNVGFGGEAEGWGSGQTTLEIIGKNSGNPTASGAISFKTQDATTGFATIYSPSGTLEFWTGSFADNQRRLTINNSGRVDITGSLYVNGTPKVGTVDLIKAFSKLRDAVKDEDTVEALKESITNCIGGLIEEWESMQASTQEISE